MNEAHFDLQHLAEKVLLQAMSDYVRLQHRRTRKKGFMESSFQTAVDLFHDSEYRLEAFREDDEYQMTRDQFLMLATDRERVNYPALMEHLKKSSQEYWRERDTDFMTIQNMITIFDTPWSIYHHDEPLPCIDFDENVIHLDTEHVNASAQLIEVVVDILFDRMNIRSAKKSRELFALALHTTLKLNNSFKEELG